MASGVPEAAICVQDLDVQCVLQFTLINAAGCALHRRTNPVIHRQECLSVCRTKTTTRSDARPSRILKRTSTSDERKLKNDARAAARRAAEAAGRAPARSWAVETSSSDSLNLARATAYDADGHTRCRRRSPSARALPVRGRRAAAAAVDPPHRRGRRRRRPQRTAGRPNRTGKVPGRQHR